MLFLAVAGALTGGGARRSISRTALLASRHLASRGGGKAEVDAGPGLVPVVDAKKQALLDKLNILTEDNVLQKDVDVKTGAQLRKERKGELRKKRLQDEAIERQKLIHSGGAAAAAAAAAASRKGPKAKVRFVLGNKIEGLTAAQLVELVRSTAPYLFPETAPKMVLDDEDDDDEEEEEVKDDEGKVTGGSRDARQASASVLELAADPKRGHLNLLRALPPRLPPCEQPTEQQRVEYFALCLAAHFSTVATFVPTDVDSKIRGHCWEDPSQSVLAAQFEVLKLALRWEVEAVSTRAIRVAGVSAGAGGQQAAALAPVLSGHDGEWLGVLCGAWGAFLKTGNREKAAEAEALVEQELQREAALFASLRRAAPSTRNDVLLLKAAAILTHNVGDVDQGLGYWYNEEDARTPVPAALVTAKLRFSRLAHERPERFGGEFALAKALYKELLSAEGHRHYPLREARCLRRAPELMLPLGPFLEGWGRAVASHPGLGHEDKLSVLRQLLRGCDSTSRAWCVPNQVGYYRALNGFASVSGGGGGGGLERWVRDLGQAEAAVLREHTTRLHLGLSEEAYANKLAARAREVLEDALAAPSPFWSRRDDKEVERESGEA